MKTILEFMKQLCTAALFLTMSGCLWAQKKKDISFSASSPEIVYAGRIDFSNANRASFCYPGVSIATVFSGTSLSMVLEDHAMGDEQHTNYYTVLLNDKVHKTLEAKPGKKTYELVSGLPEGKHRIEIIKRTECSVGSSTFHGFSAPEGTLLEKPVAKTRRIEFVGNSLTCGYGNEASIPAPPEGNPSTGFLSKNENHYMAYGSILSRELNADYTCVAYSGRGLYRNNTGSEEGTMPKVYARIFPDESAGPLWDLKKNIPDVLLINLGSNDFAPEAQGNFVDDKVFAQTYVQFIRTLRAHYPDTKIICVVGNAMSDYWPEGRQCWTRIQKIVQRVVEEVKDDKVFYFKLNPQTPPYGEDWHPSIATHQKMAKQLGPFVEEVMGW